MLFSCEKIRHRAVFSFTDVPLSYPVKSMFRVSVIIASVILQSCLLPVKKLIKHHKEATQWDGPRCPMYPSCASWGEHAIEQHGWIGFFLTVDRLMIREGGSLHNHYTIAPRRLSADPRFYDPVDDGFGNSKPSLFSIEISEQP
jgi:putative component of membrane protein insertase Oxa1/YidC/SpoIIIJ protein YidD